MDIEILLVTQQSTDLCNMNQLRMLLEATGINQFVAAVPNGGGGTLVESVRMGDLQAAWGRLEVY